MLSFMIDGVIIMLTSGAMWLGGYISAAIVNLLVRDKD